MTYPMNFTWRGCFFMLFAMGLVAAVYCALVLAGIDLAPEGEKAGKGEAAAGLVVGLLLLPFAVTGLRHARLEITDEELRYLGFGFFCTTRAIELSRIERFGTGTVKGSGGGNERILILETIDGQQPQIKLAMYQRWGEFLKELGQRIGKEPQEVKRSLKGLSFVDSI